MIGAFTVAIVGLVVYDSRRGLSSTSTNNQTAPNDLVTDASAGSNGELSSRLRIVFTKLDEDFHEQLFILPFDTSQLSETHDPKSASSDAVQVSDAEISVWDFAASLAHSQIVYSSMNQDSTSDLWLLSGDQTDAELLLECEDASCNGPALSPDGRFLAFTKRGATTVSTTGGLSPPRLWLLNLDSGDTAQIFSDNQVLGFTTSWSASSRWISYLAPESNGVGLYNLNDAQKGFYETQTGELGAWHPSDDLLVFPKLLQIDSQYLIHLYLADPATGALTDLSGAEARVEDVSAVWSPDGQRIAFRRRMLDAEGSFGKQIWVMRKDGAEAKALTEADGFDHGLPQWSPDGRYLLYHRFPLQGPDIVLSVWITNVETGEHFEVARPGQRPQWG